MKIKAHLKVPSIEELKKATGLNKGGKVQEYIDSFVFYHSEPYLPGEHLHKQSVHSNNFGQGYVIWNVPDANYLYEGKLMVDPIAKVGAFPIRNGKISFKESDGDIEGFVSRKNTPKIMDPQNRNLNYHGGNLRGDHWFDRMMGNDQMNELIKGVKNITNGGK